MEVELEHTVESGTKSMLEGVSTIESLLLSSNRLANGLAIIRWYSYLFASILSVLETLRGRFLPCVTRVGLLSEFKYTSFRRRTFETVLDIVRQMYLLYLEGNEFYLRSTPNIAVQTHLSVYSGTAVHPWGIIRITSYILMFCSHILIMIETYLETLLVSERPPWEFRPMLERV